MAKIFLILSFAWLTLLPQLFGLEDGIYAEIKTNRGDMTLELYYKNVPYTVMNFIGLAEGSFAHDRKTNQRYYDQTVFHRVIPGFMAQGGDPTASGRGGPGYRFRDEIDPTLKHDSVGILSMANAGPNTNGSQFFITFGPTKWLNNKHAVFGKLVKGMDTLAKIKQGDKIETLTIKRVGAEAKAFVVDQEKFNEWAGL